MLNVPKRKNKCLQLDSLLWDQSKHGQWPLTLCKMKYLLVGVAALLLQQAFALDFVFEEDGGGMLHNAVAKALNPSSYEDIKESFQNGVYNLDDYSGEQINFLKVTVESKRHDYFKITSFYFKANGDGLFVVYDTWRGGQEKHIHRFILMGKIEDGRVVFTQKPQPFSNELFLATIQYISGGIAFEEYESVRAKNRERANYEIIERLTLKNQNSP